jgi:single-stranded DNA-binding protein
VIGKIGKESSDTQDREGIKRYTTEIVANQMLMLGTRDQTESARSGDAPSPDFSGTQVPAQDDDDIPF